MNETKQLEALAALAEVARQREQHRQKKRLASVRVSAGAYLAAASVLTFISVLLLRSGRDVWALVAVGIGWLIVPALALSDRIVFDGLCLSRRGLVPFIHRLISGRRQQLNVADFERVDTNAVRTLRRGGRVRYRYRSQIIGKGTAFVLASGGKSYRAMVRQLFPLIHDDKLDLRTRELRDYLCDPQSLTSDLKMLQLASTDVLDSASMRVRLGGRKAAVENREQPDFPTPSDIERALSLRLLGNKLRVQGRLREAGEAFRRALNVLPKDGWLIYDFGRLLRSQASAQGDARLLSRARAALRLSSMRAGKDSNLLALIGEALLECGETERAQHSFQFAVDLNLKSFKARLGLADVAMRTGKLAHVIHQYREASQVAEEKALVLYARREADYYALLNEDDDYLSAELRRMSWLQNSNRVRRFAARVANASILLALTGPYIDPAIAGIGWSFASSSLVAWVSSLFATKFLSQRGRPRRIS